MHVPNTLYIWKNRLPIHQPIRLNENFNMYYFSVSTLKFHTVTFLFPVPAYTVTLSAMMMTGDGKKTSEYISHVMYVCWQLPWTLTFGHCFQRNHMMWETSGCPRRLISGMNQQGINKVLMCSSKWEKHSIRTCTPEVACQSEVKADWSRDTPQQTVKHCSVFTAYTDQKLDVSQCAPVLTSFHLIGWLWRSSPDSKFIV